MDEVYRGGSIRERCHVGDPSHYLPLTKRIQYADFRLAQRNPYWPFHHPNKTVQASQLLRNRARVNIHLSPALRLGVVTYIFFSVTAKVDPTSVQRLRCRVDENARSLAPLNITTR